MGTRISPVLTLIAGVALSGCGPAGPEVRLSPDALSWKPSMVALLPAIAAGNAIPSGGVMPEGIERPTAAGALAAITGPLTSAFREHSGVNVAPLLFTSTEAGKRAETAVRQYLDVRGVDPAVAAKLGVDTGAEAILLVAVIRYGPEVDEVQKISQSANTTVGKSALNISSTAARTILYFNVQFRCALVRCADGIILWDAGVRKREKKLAVLNVTQESVLNAAISELVATFPYSRPRPEAGPAR